MKDKKAKIVEILEKHEGERGYGIDFEPAATEILALFEKAEEPKIRVLASCHDGFILENGRKIS